MHVYMSNRVCRSACVHGTCLGHSSHPISQVSQTNSRVRRSRNNLRVHTAIDTQSHGGETQLLNSLSITNPTHEGESHVENEKLFGLAHLTCFPLSKSVSAQRNGSSNRSPRGLTASTRSTSRHTCMGVCVRLCVCMCVVEGGWRCMQA